jgi:hypothetical protein
MQNDVALDSGLEEAWRFWTEDSTSLLEVAGYRR